MSKAEEYSFNIPSELFQQLTKEQQVLWRKETENTFNNGYHQAEEDLHKSIYKAGFLDGFEDAVEGQYEKGYEQAEKDLELTWEDIQKIDVLIYAVLDEEKYKRYYTQDRDGDFYEEVLKRFKDFKERKDGGKG